MTIWRHKDARDNLGGCLGFTILLVAAALMLLTWLRGEAVSIGIWLIAGVGGAIIVWYVRVSRRAEQRIAAYQQRRNEMANAIRAAVLAGNNPETPYFVYLRPFDIDEKFVEAPRLGGDAAYVEEYGWPAAYHDLESALALFVYPFGKLVALSDEAGKAGAGYVRSTDLTWQEEVHALCEHAEGIFVVPFDFEGTAWEVEMLTESGWLGKTFFVMPASIVLLQRLGLKFVSRDYGKLWEAGRARYRWLNLPEYDDDGAIVQAIGEVRLLLRFRNVQTDDLKMLRARLQELSATNKSP